METTTGGVSSPQPDGGVQNPRTEKMVKALAASGLLLEAAFICFILVAAFGWVFGTGVLAALAAGVVYAYGINPE